MMQLHAVNKELALCLVQAFDIVSSCECAGGRRKPVPKVTITELNRRVTGEAKDFDEVMAQARRVSQGGDM